MPNDAPLISTREAAALLRLSRRDVIRLINQGDLSAEKLPGKTGSYVLQRGEVLQFRDRRDDEALQEMRTGAAS